MRQPDSLDRALRPRGTAVEAAPVQPLPYYALARLSSSERRLAGFRVAAERAIALNPMDGATARSSVCSWPTPVTGSAAAL